MRKKYLWLFLILWLALALRLFRLGEQSLWYDEGVTWYLTQFSLPELIGWTAADIQPPLYYIIVWFSTRLFGQSEFALRFPSVVFGVLAVPVVWQASRGDKETRRQGDKGTGRQGERRTTHNTQHATRNPVLSEAEGTQHATRNTNWWTFLTSASFFAALFSAVAPLMIYYSQEARMYTLLVFQASLGSYLLLRVASSKTKNKTTITYTLVMASALYTHYFSAFLLIAHFIYLIVVYISLGLEQKKNTQQRSAVPKKEGQTLRGRRSSRLLKQGGGAFLGVALFFAPWLPILLSRLGDDPSYWPGALKLGEVVQDVLISFAVGGKREMIFEADGLSLAIGFGTLLVLSVILLAQGSRGAGEQGSRGDKERRASGQGEGENFTPSSPHPLTLSPLLFLLLWLVIPIAFIILLSYQTPKFNPRYAIMSWPAFALILAGGLSRLGQGSRGAREQGRGGDGEAEEQNPATRIGGRRYPKKRGRLSAVGGRLLFAIILLFIAFSWTFSLRNWFFAPEFSKDDFKRVAQFVRERYTPGDAVLLSSGHLFPVWQYYFGPDNWTPLPEMETLDVNRVTNFDIIPTMERSLQGKPGVWLVQWQNEIVDPNGVIPLLLDVAGERVEDEFHYGNFWGVELAYWQLPETLDFPVDFSVDVRSDVNFGNLVKLRGMLQLPAADTEVVLLWEAAQPLLEDYRISLRLLDDAGVEWSDGTRVARPASYLYPTTRWTPGKVVVGRQALPWLPGAPPGDYWLEVGWLTADGEGVDALDASGNPQRRTVLLGPVRISEKIGGVEVDNSTPIQVVSLDLLFGAFEETEVEAGGKVIFDAVWRVNEAGEQGRGGEGEKRHPAFISWRDAEGNIFSIEPPVVIQADPSAPGTIFRSRHKLATPFEAVPGSTALQASGEEAISIGYLTLLSTERNFAPPEQLDIKIDANFANLATLLGGNINDLALSPGQSTDLTLYWRAEAPFDADYTVFVHLLGPDGAPLLNADHAPPRPTTNWIEGEIIADAVTLTFSPDLPPGVYPLEVGFYNTNDPSYARLPLADSSADYVILMEIEVLQRGK